MENSLLIKNAAQITESWLAYVVRLPAVKIRSVERIGTGQMSLTYRVQYTTTETVEESVVVKLASDNEVSRATGVEWGIYRREVAFYRHIAADLLGPPGCYLAEYDADAGWFTLVLDDVRGATAGDQIAGCDITTARQAVDTLAALHVPVVDDAAIGTRDLLAPTIPLNGQVLAAVLPMVLQRYADRIEPAHAEVCRRYVEVVDVLAAAQGGPHGLVHGDFRLDNLLFAGPDKCVVVDWQTVLWGPVMVDLSYFLGTSLEIADRRGYERELVGAYHQKLTAAGVRDFGWDQCWEEYRRQAFCAVAMAMIAPTAVERTEHGDEMFAALLRRACQQVIDLKSFDLVTMAGAPISAPLLPSAADEAPHKPGEEPLWSESWYFDAISTQSDGSLVGVYVRLGSVPNLATSVYSVAVVRPGRPTVMVCDYSCPHPLLGSEVQRIHAAEYKAEQKCIRPLCEMRVKFAGTAQQFDDDADPLHQVAGPRRDLNSICAGSQTACPINGV